MNTQEANGGDPPASPFLQTFLFGPFRLLSQLPIPELTSTTGSGQLPVTLTLGPTPTDLPGAACYGALCQLTSAEYLLEIPGIARYHVSHGRHIQVTLHPAAPPADITSYLLGSVFGALCHQNHLLPLHASSVATPSGVTAFLAESGAGKSTLAAALQRRGHTLVSDDICLLEEETSGHTMHVIPLAGWLKLWQSSLDHLGHTPDPTHRVFAEQDKFRLYLSSTPSSPISADPAPHSLALRNIIFLQRDASAATPSLVPIPPARAIAGMMRLTYLAYVTELTGSHARIFSQCALALQHARAFHLTVPSNLAHLDSTLDLLESSW